jgi:hypothetical protein
MHILKKVFSVKRIAYGARAKYDRFAYGFLGAHRRVMYHRNTPAL